MLDKHKILWFFAVETRKVMCFYIFSSIKRELKSKIAKLLMKLQAIIKKQKERHPNQMALLAYLIITVANSIPKQVDVCLISAGEGMDRHCSLSPPQCWCAYYILIILNCQYVQHDIGGHIA